MATVTELKKYARARKARLARLAQLAKTAPKANGAKPAAAKSTGAKSGAKDIDHFIKTAGLDSQREKEIGQHIGYRYDVNLVPDYSRLTPFLKKYMEVMRWKDLNWLEDVHLGYEEGKAAVFDRNVNGRTTSRTAT
jgi:hypothetical protein